MSPPRPGRGRRRRAALLALALATLLPGPPASAQDPDRPRLDAEASLEARWRARATELQEKVEIARERLATAEAAYEQMRALNHPRGEGKRAVIRRVEDATHALAEAEQERALFAEAADVAGVPASWLEPL